ncbi:APC family permease [Streptomyces sp. NPDC002644]
MADHEIPAAAVEGRRPGLGSGTGAALCVGAVLGPGALTLASSAAAEAGPGSVLAWSVLIAVSLPIARVFAALGARHPDGGGVSAFAGKAFGPWLARPVGWWFYWAVPLGVPAAALIGGAYTAAAAGWGPATAAVVALLVLGAAYGANLVGLRLSGGLQLLLVGLLAALLSVTIAVTGTHVDAAAFSPFLPYGWSSVGTAAGVLFFAFAGWEAISHLSAEFRDPERDLPRATLLAWCVVTVLYLGLAVVTVGVLGAAAGSTTTPLTLLLETAFGAPARPVAAAVALLLTFGAVNAYLAGGARMGESLARQGAMPGRPRHRTGRGTGGAAAQPGRPHARFGRDDRGRRRWVRRLGDPAAGDVGVPGRGHPDRTGLGRRPVAGPALLARRCRRRLRRDPRRAVLRRGVPAGARRTGRGRRGLPSRRLPPKAPHPGIGGRPRRVSVAPGPATRFHA